MSKTVARDILARLDQKPIMVGEGHEQAFYENLRQYATSSRAENLERAADSRRNTASSYGFDLPSEPEKDFIYHDGVAIIPVHGALVNRFSYSFGYITGYNFIREQIRLAMADDDVQLIVFDVDSGGGEVAGCFELADWIYDQRGGKPMVSVVDSICCSAAYAVASSTDRIIVTPTGRVGSIGVVATHISYEKMLEQDGVKVTLIAAGKRKVDGNRYQDLPEDVRARIQADVEKDRDEFVELVVRNRGLDETAVRETEAEAYRPDEAQEIGLIDSVSPPSEAVSSFLAEIGVTDPAEEEVETDMSANAKPPVKGQTPAAAAADTNEIDVDALKADARKEGAKAERERISGILSHAEAVKRPKMARALADDAEGFSVEVAGRLLAAAPEEVTSTVAAPEPEKKPTASAAPAKSPFQAAMDASGGAGAGKNDDADGNPDPEAEKKPGARGAAILDMRYGKKAASK